MADDTRIAQLFDLATSAGVETDYWDVQGGHHVASVEGLLAILRVMGHDVNGLDSVAGAQRAHQEHESKWVTDPLLVAWKGQPFAFDLRLPAEQPPGRIELSVGESPSTSRAPSIGVVDLVSLAARDIDDAGGRRRVYRIEVPAFDRDVGPHDLWISGIEGGPVRRNLLVAPRKVVGFGPSDRLWGVFAPAYSLPGGSGLGANVGDLGRLASAIDGVGAKVVGALPMLAAWLTEPFDPSPYSPVSRRFWNDLYVDLAALDELAFCPDAVANLEGLHSIGHAANVKSKTFDYRHQYGYVRGVLNQVCHNIQSWNDQSVQRFFDDDDVLDDRRDVHEYARFRAFADKMGTGWNEWPEPQRSGTITEGDVDDFDAMVYRFGQYAMRRDLKQLDADLRSRGQRLYLDLPVGAHGDGYDTWKHRELFAWGAAAGAPPDDFFTGGQNWGFPPLLPQASSLEGHAYFRDVLRHHMEVAGILRLDHVMGLHRLFWVPDGMDARDGVYVRYPRDELLAVLAIESQANDCIVVGEDLGTVPDEIREAMDERGLLGMYVAQFGQPSWAGAPLEDPQSDQLASIDTHDTPTFSGWLHGFDIDRRHQMGLLRDDVAELNRGQRHQQVENVCGFLRARGDLRSDPHKRGGELDDAVILEGLLRFLGDSAAPVVLVTLDDLVGQTNPQNVPGTMSDRPNWVQRLPMTVDELVADEHIAAVFAAIQDCRLGSHLRAVDVEGGGVDG